ncbi:DNA/RNA nuclease SfsA [Bacillaceae bacterium S4-13-58]
MIKDFDTPIWIPWSFPLIETTFIERPNRYIIHCRKEGSEDILRVHLPDPGRLIELLNPGVKVYLHHIQKEGRKTEYSAVLVQTNNNILVSLNPNMANDLVRKALQNQAIPFFQNKEIEYVRREYSYGGARWDFLLQDQNSQIAVEVKSVTFAKDGIAYFPDAVTERGRKHVQKLTDLHLLTGWKGTLIFVAQREDVQKVLPATWIDPKFSAAIQEAVHNGLPVIAVQAKCSKEGILLYRQIPFSL